MTRLAAVPEAVHRDGAYVRVSALMGRSGEDFLSPSIQLDAIRGASARSGGTVVEVFEDIDVSGRSMIRDGLEAAQTAARERRIDRLFVYDLSRWARNAAEGLVELAAIERTGVEVVSATEAVDRSTSSGRLTAGMLLLLAEHYSDLVGDRWRGVIAENARRGVLHGRAPIGYVRTERRTVEVDPILGPLMTDAFRRAAAGESIQLLAREMSRRAGRTIWPRTLRQSFLSPAYLGLVRHKGATLPGRHPALTDQETWDTVRVRLEASAQIPSRTKEARYALAGLARCGGCDRALWRRKSDGRMKGDYFVCRSKLHDGMSECPGIGVPYMVDVENIVLEQLRLLLVDRPDESAARALRDSQQARQRSDLRAVLDELGRVERSLGSLAVKLAEGVLSDAAYGAAVQQLEAKARALREQRAQAEVDVADQLTFTQAQDQAAALLELWPGMEPQARNAALRTHVERVVVHRGEGWRPKIDGRVEVVFRAGA